VNVADFLENNINFYLIFNVVEMVNATTSSRREQTKIMFLKLPRVHFGWIQAFYRAFN
jgi:hypothetical protein